MEQFRWSDGPECPHCGSDAVARLTPKPTSKRPGRKGLLKSRACRKQFTVTVGTIFEDSHIPLHKWLLAIHLLCPSKKGFSAHELHRTLGVTYKSAWFLAHRIRYAMTQPPLSDRLDGVVEADETYVGGKSRKGTGPHKRGRGTLKTPVVSFVERNGRVQSFVVERVTGKNLRQMLREHVAQTAVIMSDGYQLHNPMKDGYAGFETVNHSAGEYARNGAHINTVEVHFALIKQAAYRTHNHWSKPHLHRYLAERDFVWNTRALSDGRRTVLVIQDGVGKRSFLRRPHAPLN